MTDTCTHYGCGRLKRYLAIVVYKKDGKPKGKQEILAFKKLRLKETQRFNV